MPRLKFFDPLLNHKNAPHPLFLLIMQTHVSHFSHLKNEIHLAIPLTVSDHSEYHKLADAYEGARVMMLFFAPEEKKVGR